MNAFVTGGSRGIGRAIVLRYVKEGWGCAFVYAGNTAAAEETVRLASEIDPKAHVKAYRMDLKKPDEIEKTVEAAIAEFGDITAVVNNAAVLRNNAAVLMSNEEWEEVIATNLSGPFYVIRSFLMHFLSNRNGRFIAISSLGEQGASGQVNYSASKSGLTGLTRTIAKEYGAKGISANVVSIGFVPTDMTSDPRSQALGKFWAEHCPMKRVGNAEEIAGLVLYLSRDEAAYVNGEVIRICGAFDYIP